MKGFQRCTRCVMDNTSDTTITFNSSGHCNYCSEALSQLGKVYFPNEEGEKRLNILIARLKKENKEKQYDCIMGISGGLDSSYLAYLGAVKWGLRILGVHVDDGYDTEISKNNIQNLCRAAKIKLVTINPDAKQFNELTRAYILAGVPNLAAPQDNVLFACVYQFAKEQGIRTFLSGGNFALECILQRGNTHDAYDVQNIKDINQQFGREKINKLQLISNLQRDVDAYLLGIETPRPLNYIDYNRKHALKELNEFCGFEYYGGKHLENTLTKFIQVYWFYHKFNVDKRKSHLSSMIVSNQMSRDRALEILEEPLYDENQMQKDIDFILNRVNIPRKEFEHLMKLPPRQHTDYKTSLYTEARKKIRRVAKIILRK
ncbi:MAG: N-acetyl sugar amidotransferase [Aminobacterium colombiense]|jgi:N-acetyl sugar amidotransferase|uniref:N-acetyl sugar amidotransferase n=1 Tax=Aminobacterium colombiense TaxID=81468 RepID=UPI003D987B35